MTNLANPALYTRYAVSALAALLPFLVIPVSWASTVQSKMLLLSVIVVVAAVAWGYSRYRESSVVFPRSPLVLVAVVLVAVYLLSAIFSGASPSSFFSGTGEQDTVVIVALFAAICMLGALAFSRPEEASLAFFRPLMAGGLVLMLVQFIHLFVPAMTLGVLSAAATSVFGSWHEVGIIAGLYLFLVVALWRTPVISGLWRPVAIVLGVLSALMLVVVNMIDVWYVFGALMLLYGAYTWFRARTLHITVISAVIGFLAIGCALTGPYVYEVLPAKLQVLQVEVRPSWGGTFAIGRESIDSPRTALLGTGPNTFTRQWSLYKPLGVNSTEFWNVDFNAGVGFIPTTFVTVGILGILAWALLVLVLLWRFVTRVREASAFETALFGAAVYLIAFHILYVPTVSFSALTFLILGVFASSHGVRGPWSVGFTKGDPAGIARAAALIVGVLAVLVVSFFTVRAVLSDLMVNKSAVVYNTSQDTDKALSLLQTAVMMNPSNDRAHRAAVELGLIRLGEISTEGGSTDQARAELQVSLQTTIQHGLAAVSINSADYRNWLALAGLYRDLAGAGVEGAYENARDAYEQAYADNPGNPVPLVQMAQLNIAQSKLTEAIALLDEAIKLKPDFAAAYFLRSHAHSTLGNSELAISDASTVAQVATEDPLAWYNLGTVLFDAEKYSEAAQALEQAAALQADYANALFVLGLTYEKLERNEDALRIFERIAEKNPSDPTLKAVIENVRAGRPAMSTSSPD